MTVHSVDRGWGSKEAGDEIGKNAERDGGLAGNGERLGVDVFAQGEGGGGGVYGAGSRAPWMMAGIPAHKAGSGQDCPSLAWHINRQPSPGGTVNLSGPIWYENGSGVSFAQGTGQPDGTYSLDVKSVSGDGPAGTISGKRFKNGSVDVNATGTPCFSGKFHLRPGQTSAKL